MGVPVDRMKKFIKSILNLRGANDKYQIVLKTAL